MNRLPFTKYASKALNEGREIAGYLGFKDVSSIFVLLGLYGADGSLASEVLKMHGVTRELIEEAIKEKSKMPKDRRKGAVISVETLEKQQELASIQENLRMLVAEAVCKGVTEDEMNRLIHDMYQKLDRK